VSATVSQLAAQAEKTLTVLVYDTPESRQQRQANPQGRRTSWSIWVAECEPNLYCSGEKVQR
jgi:hypothetical protein